MEKVIFFCCEFTLSIFSQKENYDFSPKIRDVPRWETQFTNWIHHSINRIHYGLPLELKLTLRCNL